MFSSEFSEISQYSYSAEHLQRVPANIYLFKVNNSQKCQKCVKYIRV